MMMREASSYWHPVAFTLVFLLTWDSVPRASAVGDEDSTAGVSEHCSFETFNVSCGYNEVLLIRSAHYGRMRIGRCVKAPLGFLGCSADVGGFVGARCTGRRHCSLPVADDGLRVTRPCPEDVTWYLEVNYECVKVLSKEDSKCRPDGTPAPDPPHSSGYIASLIAVESHYGRERCPWTLIVDRGQRIRLLLKGYYTAPPSTAQASGHSDDTCVEIGAVLADGGQTVGGPTVEGRDGQAGEMARRPIVVCRTELGQRDRPVYVSETNRISVALTATGPDNVYLMAFEAVGCSTPRLPPRAFSQRTGDKMVVRCNDTEEKWSLVCRDSSWVGTVGNCSGYGRTNEKHRFFPPGQSALPMSILIAVAVGVALGIFIGGALLALVGSRMNRRHKSHLQDGAYATTMLMSGGGASGGGGPLDGKHFDRQYADCEELTSKGRLGVGGCVGGGGTAGEYASNSLRNDLALLPAENAVDRTNFYRQEQHCSVSGTGSPFVSSALHHHHHHHLAHHPYESPVILT